MAQVAGNLQRIRNGQRTYAITPHIPAGFIQPEMLDKISQVARTFHATVKVTGAQRIMITGLKAEDVDKAWDMLGMTPAPTTRNRVRSVKVCPGMTFCKRGKQDSIHLGMQLDKKYIGLEVPSKLKMGVAGCLNSCTEAALKDIGVIGQVEGWDVYAGGSGGAHPRIADLIAHVDTEAQVLALVDRIFNYYKDNAQIERMGEFIDRIALETFKEAVIGDLTAAPTESKAPVAEPQLVLPGQGNQGLDEAQGLQAGDLITANTIVREIVDTYPNCIPVLQSIGMGCLGCPSSTMEPLWQAANIHGEDVDSLLQKLNAAR